MKSEGLQYFTDQYLLIIGLLIFVSLFLGFVAWVFRKDRQGLYQEVSKLPLQEMQGE